MSTLEDRLKRVWFTSGHGDLWNCNSTYCPVPYKMLPDLDDVSDDFSWLDDVSPFSNCCTLDSDDNRIANLLDILGRTQSLGFELPDTFIRFMSSPELQAKVPTCTCCFLELSEAPIPVPMFDENYVLRFVNDSQSCMMWYLLLQPQLPPKVLATPYFFEPDIFAALSDEGDEAAVKYESILEESCICADSFKEFIYRFWVENSIWYSLRDKRPLSSREMDYRSKITSRL